MKKFENMRNDKRTGKQWAYILDAIHNDGESFADDADAVRYVWERFNDEYNNAQNKRICPNLSERVGQWLQGLPSCVGIAYTCADIIEIGRGWGYCQTERKAEQFCADWFRVMGWRFVQLAEALGLC